MSEVEQSGADRMMAEADALHALNEEKRRLMMREVARYRWLFATQHHRLENGEPLDFDRWHYQKEIYQCAAPEIVVMGSTGQGKAQPLDAMIRVPCGWLRMRDAKVGDIVCTPSGVNAKIAGVYPQGPKEIWRVNMRDGRWAEACAEHLWEVFTGKSPTPQIVNTMRLKEMLDKGEAPKLRVARHRRVHSRTRRKMRVYSVRPSPVPVREAQCVLLDNTEHLYITNCHIVTHNTEVGICDDIARAAAGMRVFHVLDTAHKREKLVQSRIDPILKTVPAYRQLFRAAKARQALVDNTRFKHLGDGSVNFIGANSESDFSTHRADSVLIDEHQLCDQGNIRKIFHRLSGSDWRFTFFMGNPRGAGTDENQNLAWEYQNSDQRRWHVPCPNCRVPQELGWWSHFIEEVRNEHGAVLEVRLRDQQRAFGVDGKEFRPICVHCHSPMIRLTKEGFWKAMNPGLRRAGFQISNLYNPTSNIIELYEFYKKSLHDPKYLADFINDQLGLPYSSEGDRITDELLQSASTGQAAGVAPYRLVRASGLSWRDLDN